MKKLFLSCLIFTAAVMAATGEVVFIPGWNTELFPKSYYEIPLRRVYPNDRITVLKWKSDTKGSFSNGIINADAFVPEAVRYIISKPPEEQAELTLIGHSLGGRIAVNVATQLAKDNLKIKRVILLGSAVGCDVDLVPVVAASREYCINVFSWQDQMLKYGYLNYLYLNHRNTFPLGLCGASAPPKEHFVEYRMTIANNDVANLKSSNETFVHAADKYLDELRRITAGECVPYRPEYDYSNAEEYLRRTKTDLSIPEGVSIPPPDKMKIIDSHAGWNLIETTMTIGKNYLTVFLVIDHYGRIRRWNLIDSMLRRDFDKIKALIVENR